MRKYTVLRSIRLLLEWLVFIGLVSLVVIFAMTAGILPPPALFPHAGGGGLVVEYGMRPVLLLLFLAGCAVIGALFLLSCFPRFYRYPVEITARNVEVQYLLAKIMLGMAQFLCAVYFCILLLLVYRMRIEMDSFNFWRLTAFFAIALVADVLVYIAAARANR
jgi:hypothetical protein